MDTLEFNTATIEIGPVIDFRLRSIVDASKNAYHCTLGCVLPKGEHVVEKTEDVISIVWAEKLSLKITYTELEDGLRYDFRWEGKEGAIKQLCDTIAMEHAHWYGAAQVAKQLWPIEKWNRGLSAYVTGDAFKDEYGGVQERYWLSSQGIAVYVEEEVPLFVSINKGGDKKLTLLSKWSSPYRNLGNANLTLAYTIFQGNDVKNVHTLVINQVFEKPINIPDEKVFRYPIWSTWAQYKTNINQESVQQFVKDIKDRGFPASQIEIDDDWTPHYGDMTFDLKKFPDAKAMISEIHETGSRVTLWVHPFASPTSEAASQSYWIKSGVLPGYHVWWNGIAKSLDVTNPDAIAWYKANLEALRRDFGVDSFKFDAGEVNWFPFVARTMEPLSNPSAYTTKYARLAAEIDSNLRIQEVRVGFRTQSLPVMVRMMDKESSWAEDRGLRSLIPHALTFGMIGYPFVLPDMIGGNAYSTTGWPDRELYIRWLQASTLLPVMQFSVVPWNYDDDVVEITRKMVALHEEYADTICELARDAVTTGEPIIRPLWWLAPSDEYALTVDSEFLLGDNILVAPVLEKGAVSRDIYLPVGHWKDMLRGDVKAGGTWYRAYDARLDELPFFERLSDADAAAIAAEAERLASAEGTATDPEAERLAPAEGSATDPEAERLAPAESSATDPEAERVAPAEGTATDPEAERLAPAESSATDSEAERVAPAECSATDPEAERLAPAEGSATDPEAETAASEDAPANASDTPLDNTTEPAGQESGTSVADADDKDVNQAQ